MINSDNPEMNREYEDINMRQRRAACYFRNNPSAVLNCSLDTFTGVPLGGPIDPDVPGYEDAPGTKYGEPDIPLSMDIIKKPIFNSIQTTTNDLPIDAGNPLPMQQPEIIENFSTGFLNFRSILILLIHIIAIIVTIFLIWKYT